MVSACFNDIRGGPYFCSLVLISCSLWPRLKLFWLQFTVMLIMIEEIWGQAMVDSKWIEGM